MVSCVWLETTWPRKGPESSNLLPSEKGNVMAERINIIDKTKIITAHRRTVGRRIHSEIRLRERFDLEYTKVKNIIDNGGSKVLLECETNGKEVRIVSYCGKDIYFIIFKDDILTFLTKEMVENSYPEIFEPPKEEKLKLPKKKKSKKKSKRKQQELIPASELFKDN